ncbi:MAG: hypothetical protein ACI9CF_001146 [Candidatus Omnitrophota bacterium]|jgi:uncharacterized protein (TIGR01777 family)
MHLLISGGTGFIGKHLVKTCIQLGHEITLLVRPTSRIVSSKNTHFIEWDQLQTLSSVGFDAIINLAGERVVNGRWTEARKAILKKSRTQPTQKLVEFINACEVKPKAFLSASAIGYYGNRGDTELDEYSSPGEGFLSDMCQAWELEAQKASSEQTRVINMRIGVVVGKDGGVLDKFIPPFKHYVGGPIGSGKQWLSWIHSEDIVQSILFLVFKSQLEGAFNLVSPNSVTMQDFCNTLGEAMHKPSWLPVPSFVLKLLMGEMANVVLDSQRLKPKRLLDEGYVFTYDSLKPALNAIINH